MPEAADSYQQKEGAVMTERCLALGWFMSWLMGGAWGLTQLTFSRPDLLGPLLPAAILLWVGLLFAGRKLLAHGVVR